MRSLPRLSTGLWVGLQGIDLPVTTSLVQSVDMLLVIPVKFIDIQVDALLLDLCWIPNIVSAKNELGIVGLTKHGRSQIGITRDSPSNKGILDRPRTELSLAKTWTRRWRLAHAGTATTLFRIHITRCDLKRTGFDSLIYQVNPVVLLIMSLYIGLLEVPRPICAISAMSLVITEKTSRNYRICKVAEKVFAEESGFSLVPWLTEWGQGCLGWWKLLVLFLGHADLD
ncbi:hypothetical protein BELL_1457g00020 [Botrytis elliptica]|uniref:Uncharacterized protein n=1 Tax=Botrytis elliptica TaxID=278938 RepID=A0A4Z1IF29_9HELO|nr:hypothetical protein BELL_1457g00020 [Botrytis elliptica]